MRWQWHQLDHMQVICTSLRLQTDNDASTSPLNFLQAGCSSNSVKTLKVLLIAGNLSEYVAAAAMLEFCIVYAYSFGTPIGDSNTLLVLRYLVLGHYI